MAGLSVQLDPAQLDELANLVAARLVSHLGGISTSADAPRWLTTREAAEHLRMNRSEVHRAAAAGAIPHEQDGPGCALRFRVAELDEWIRAGRPGLPRRSHR
jgi:excisionase family DNA binding protein